MRPTKRKRPGPVDWGDVRRRLAAAASALDGTAQPMFVECKGYSFVGESRLRLRVENMPEHRVIRQFAGTLGDRLGYKVAAEREDSRVVLLTRDGALHPIQS